METITVNGLDFALFNVFGRWHVECRGLIEDFDTHDGALSWIYTLAHP